MSDKAVIVSGGKFENAEFLPRNSARKIHHLRRRRNLSLQKLNIKPDMFLGDFDSCNFDEIEKVGIFGRM
ncbi:MAG: hypothetical protein L6V93_10940 [Clostridiales bacterium]|nr:MAG: hypothetical protein L6V93_10940 [Clostridiales bacterium]